MSSTTRNIEHVVPECELFYKEGGQEQQQQSPSCCKKNPDHVNFIPADKFVMNHLPEAIRKDEVYDVIRASIDRTVKVVVKCTSGNRPDTYPNSSVPYPYSEWKGSDRVSRAGSGVISRRWQFSPDSDPFEFVKDEPCPCPHCENSALGSPKMEHVVAIVTTATHVIYDEIEARNSEFELFYNSEKSRDKVKRIFGVGLSYTQKESPEKVARSQTDRVRVKCVSHDPEMIQMFKNMESSMHCGLFTKIGDFGIIVSHPHGGSKCITVGNILARTFPRPHDILDEEKPPQFPCYKFGPGTKCRVSSSQLSSTDSSSRQLFHQLVVESRRNNNNNVDDGSTACEDSSSSSQQQQRDEENDDDDDNTEGVLVDNGMSVLLPCDASFLCQFRGLYDGWISFSPGTKFSFDGGVDWYLLPGLEVDLDPDNTDLPILAETGYLTYDADTCPGSSGAPVLYSERAQYCVYHSGAFQNGANRSTVVHKPTVR